MNGWSYPDNFVLSWRVLLNLGHVPSFVHLNFCWYKIVKIAKKMSSKTSSYKKLQFHYLQQWWSNGELCELTGSKAT